MTNIPAAAEERAQYVFISYGSEDPYDCDLAMKLEEALRIRHVEVFRDQSSIGIGEEWEKQLWLAIRRATHFVVFLSAAAADSPWVNREIEKAVARPRAELRIVGIRRSRDPKRFPQLGHLQIPECAVGEELETAFKGLGLRWLVNGRAPLSALMLDSRWDARLEAQLCDRQEIEDLFRERYTYYLDTSPGVPQAHFLVGRPDEQLDGMVARLIGTFLEAEAKALTEEGTAVRRRVVNWPNRWTVANDYAEVLERVFNAFFGEPSHGTKRNHDVRLFQQLLGEDPAIDVLVHKVSGRRWDKNMPALLAEYFRFWREVGSGGKRRLFLLFNVEVCHGVTVEGFPACETCGPVYKTLAELDEASRPAVDPGGLSSALARIAALFGRRTESIVPAVLLPLKCVERLDVEKWFLYRTTFSADCEPVCERLFARSKCQPMSSVESALIALQDRYRQEAS